MLKVLVYDSGWGGELVADFLSEELGMVEVIRLIDWPHAPYRRYSAAELNQLAKQNLHAYINKVDVIVLGGYTTSETYEKLCHCYPTQAFVRMSYSLPHILYTRNYPQHIGILLGAPNVAPQVLQRLRRELPDSELILPDCTGWEELVDDGELTSEQIFKQLGHYFLPSEKSLAEARRTYRNKRRSLPLAESLKLSHLNINAPAAEVLNGELSDTSTSKSHHASIPVQIDTVLILDTHFWEIRPELEKFFGWRVRVLDFRHKLLHDVCAALGLRGVDGSRDR